MAARKPVSLHAHKNKLEQRRKRELAKDATKAVEAIIREQDVRAYAFVAISSEGATFCRWDTGAILPMWAFAGALPCPSKAPTNHHQPSDQAHARPSKRQA
jgi:hypothetical protein